MLFFTFPISAQNDCGSNRDLKKLKKDNPVAYQEFLRIEKLTEEYRATLRVSANQRLINENGLITIPVVFHILHLGEAIGTGTNLNDARIINQVAILNAAYTQTNNQAAIPQAFLNVAGSPNFNFVLACIGPDGSGTNGILRRQTTANQIFSQANESAKSTALNGDDPWPTDRYLNIWITPNLLGAFGYAQFPDEFTTKPNTDGVVIRFDAIGVGAGTNAVRSQGHTLVHEIGHWLNVAHLFDGGCSGNDFCNDTPQQENLTLNSLACNTITFPRNANVCPNSPNGDMFDNFMDNTNENCGRRMFTNDQAIRMRAVFQTGGPRRGFIDNYFKLALGNTTCALSLYQVRTPFCQANGNIVWGITGPATSATAYGSNTLRHVTPQSGANGVAVLTASFNNFISDIEVQIGYGTESSTFRVNGNLSPPTSINNSGYSSARTNSFGKLIFTGATGVATNWRKLSQSSGQVNLSGSGNDFNLSVTPGNYVVIAADIPTVCGIKTVQYTFYNSGVNYALSPNPASNNITIAASSVNANPNARTTSEVPEYEVQIFNRYSQLIKKSKCPQGSRDITIDVANLPSNQIYTVKLISDSDVQTKSFFKE
jgi:Pregnancy-associated plasma protein-A/Secretion system C-terminal sorting domain